MIANCGRDPRTVEIGREWISADLLLGNLPDTPATLTSTSLHLAGWDARIYSAHGNATARDTRLYGHLRCSRWHARTQR